MYIFAFISSRIRHKDFQRTVNLSHSLINIKLFYFKKNI
ncbi:hypothetical protein CSC02_1376 [Enterobacter hormaechei subsp. hoffmannii]|nr:hypothetical protein CSC02_1376 [Enterobacter hormaechei subsp. hoffmannii]